VVVYLFQFGSQYLTGIDIPAGAGMKINEYILRGEYWRLITPVFLHGSLLHIAFNMYALNVLGPSLERFYGHWQFLAIYLVSGFAGVVGSFAFTTNPSLGASTAVFGLLAAQGVFAYRNQQVFGARARSVFHNVIRIAFINLLIGMTPGIDNWGHMGGLVGGLMIAWLGGPIYTIRGRLPNLDAVNTRSDLRFFLAVALTVIVFGLISAGFIYSRLNI
jgi:rhomboid protease GluP